MTENPTPLYKIGQTIWFAHTETTQKRHPCPDCLGTRKWKVVTPAGSEMETDCMRCGNWVMRDIPSLTYLVHEPRVSHAPINGLSINAWGRPGIQYETSRGSVMEPDVILTEEAALAEAERLAVARNATESGKREAIDSKRASIMHVDEARFDAFKNGMYSAWCAYRSLKESIEDLIADTGISDSGLRDALSEMLDDKIKWDHPESLEAAVIAAEAMVENGTASAALAKAVEALPQFARSALRRKTLAEAKAELDRVLGRAA